MALELNGTNKIVHDNLNNDIRTLLQPKNWIINGMFDVWQRGTSQTSIGYGSDDRWQNAHQVSTKTHSRQAFIVGQTDVPNISQKSALINCTSAGTFPAAWNFVYIGSNTIDGFIAFSAEL